MDFSKLSSNAKLAVYASVVVLVLGVVSLVNAWGALIAIPVIAAIAVLAVIFMPQLSPTTRLPASRGILLLAAGGAAALFWVIAALRWLDWIGGHLATFDTIQFLVGLTGSLVLAWTGWREFQAAGGTMSMASAGAPPPSPAAPPTPEAGSNAGGQRNPPG